MNEWIKTSGCLPPEGLAVDTKIDDQHGVRNEQQLKLHGNLWYFPDMTMYVYYRPTHWRHSTVNGDRT